jgi:hypothetical protein
MTCNFLRLGFTLPLIKYALGSRSPLGQIHFSPYWQKNYCVKAYSEHILSVPHVLSQSWIHQDIINIDDHEFIQLLMEDRVHEGREH